jgi:biotin carboxyl carrier protein
VADLQPLGDGWFLVSEGDKRWRVAIAEASDGTWVFVDGQVARLATRTAVSTRRGAKPGGDTGIMAPMPATVVSINAAVGQEVADGQTLIVLEAMKMELPIKSPRAGIVKAIHCTKGDLVQPNVSLLEIE